jgi:tetratricopeptide (TPR) repeat protein
MIHSSQIWTRVASIFAATAILTLSAGCSALPFAKSILSGDAAGKHHQREQEIIRSFESRRDQAAYEAALARWEQNDAKGCREGLEALLGRNAGYVDAHLLLAEVDLLEKRQDDALNQVDVALRLQGNNARALYTKGLVLDAMGHSADAAVYYERAAQTEPENEMYALSCKNIKEPNGSHEVPKDAVITTAYQDPVKSQKKDSSPSNVQGPLLNTATMKQTGAGNSIAAQEKPGESGKAGKSDGYAGSYAQAESAVSAEESLGEAERALSEGQVEAARFAFGKALASQPNNPQIPVVAAGAALRTNHPELAVELLAAASRHFSKSAAIYRMLGVAYYRLGDFQSSQVALQQALSLDKSSALSYFLMGCTLAKLGQAESAEAHLQQARALDPRYAVRR